MRKYVSIDIGGTAIKYGVITEDGLVAFRNEMPTEAYKGGNSILEKVVSVTRQLLQPGHHTGTFAGICISTAGVVDTEKGSILHAGPLIPQYTGIQYKKALQEQFHIPCEVENDVNCAGLAEYQSGAGIGCEPMLMLTVGTGIGGCLITGGKVFHGFGNSACEVGYMHMRGSDFQSLGSASALCKKVAASKQEPAENWNGYRIFEAAKQGDACCIRAIDEMADVLGLGIANICYVASPESVVLGGGIMAQEGYLKPKIQKAVNAYLMESIASHTKIVFARHKNEAGMLGAFYHFRNRQP